MSIPNNELREKIQAIIKAWYGLDDCFRFAPSYFRDELGEKASAIDDALLDLEGILCKTGWISVNERLPEFSQYVLVYSVDKYDNQSDAGIEIDSYDTINDIWVESSSWERVVTHWMPLPPIPEDESWLNLCLKSHPANAVSVLAVVYDPVYEEICPGKGRSVEAILYGYDKRRGKMFMDFATGPNGTITVPITDQVTHWMYYPELPDSPDNETEDIALFYLNELMAHIHCTHCDMGGKHQYKLAPSAYPLVSEIKAWLSEKA